MSQLKKEGSASLEAVLPRPDLWSRPFWDSAARGILALQSCNECGDYRYPPAPCCPSCTSLSFEWKSSSGRGRVQSWVVFHQSYYPDTTLIVPYNVAIVELEEKVRMVSNIVGCDESEIRIGLQVKVAFKDLDEGFKLPQFCIDAEM